MSLYKTKFNPFSKSLQWVLKGTLIAFKEGVDTYNSLPITGNAQNEARITNDTGHLYIWSIEASSGDISNWIDQGDIIDLQWDTIEGKPSSTPANIDDAVSKKHTQNTDTILDEGGANEVTASEIIKNIYNIMLLAFKIAVQGSLTFFNMVDSVVDEYEDESGIDGDSSINKTYDSIDDYYAPVTLTDTKLLLHCNGTDGSGTFIDDSPSAHTVTPEYNAQIDTAIKKFGTGAGLFDGSGDCLSIPDSADWAFPGDFTIDFWIRPAGLGGLQGILNQHVDQNTSATQLYLGNNDINFIVQGGIGQLSTTTSPMQNNVWQHIAFVRSGSINKIYYNGVSIPTYDTLGNNPIPNPSAPLWVGKLYTNQPYYFNGHIDELRISKGIARWTENFTPPTSEYVLATENMTLISEYFPAEAEPDNSRIVLLEEDVAPIILNTDLKAYASRDDGVTWIEGILEDEGDFDSGRILVATFDFTGQPSGTDMVYKLTTHNNKYLKIHATALLWD